MNHILTLYISKKKLKNNYNYYILKNINKEIFDK